MIEGVGTQLIVSEQPMEGHLVGELNSLLRFFILVLCSCSSVYDFEAYFGKEPSWLFKSSCLEIEMYPSAFISLGLLF
jgi:hypothetical protein